MATCLAFQMINPIIQIAFTSSMREPLMWLKACWEGLPEKYYSLIPSFLSTPKG